MNVTEANAVQALLTWLFDPHADDDQAETAAREAAANLADRAHDRLGAGRQYLDVLEGWPGLLQGCAGCQTCDPDGHPDQPLIEDVQLAPDGPL